MRPIFSHAGKGLVTLPLVLAVSLARADYFTAANGVVGTSMRHPSSKAGLDYGAQLTSAIDIATSETASDSTGYDFASSHLQVVAEMGRLHAKAETYATHAYTGLGNEGIGGGEAFVFPNAAAFGSNGRPVPGDPYAGGYWEDVLHVQSANLGYGSAVQFRLHMTLESDVSKDVPLATNATYVALTTYFGGAPLYLRNDDGSGTLTVDQIVTAHVGDDVFMKSTLGLFAETSFTHDGTASYANVDALNTGIFTLESLTPGATYTTDSGWRYQAVPEPSALAALGLGAMALLRRRRKA